jgi:predicted phage terminase large subunit-like protein
MTTASLSPITDIEAGVLYRTDFESFIQRSFIELNPEAPFAYAPHLAVLAQKLEACRKGEISRLIICVPPRSLKSHCASIAFPAWLLGHDPAAQIICVSYGKDLADKFARDTRILMGGPMYQRLFPHTRLSDRTARDDFATTRRGNRMATSVGGVLTGRGADFIIIDDPMKPDEAHSDTARQAVNDWWDRTLVSRLNDKKTGCIVIVMQRLHEDDLVGHVLEKGDWDVVSFPAIAEEDEDFPVDGPLGRWTWRRRTGDLLQPEREPLTVLEDLKASLGSYNFAAQYQQSPMPIEGGHLKRAWLQYYDPDARPKRFTMVLQSWDTAHKAGELNDYSVCTTWGYSSGKYYLLYVFRKKLEYPDLKRAIHDQAELYGPSVILIEDKASGTPLIQELKREGVVGVKPYSPPSGTDKVMRFLAQTPLFESGQVLLPRMAPWLDIYLRELTGFPGVRNDDQVDSTTQALDYMKQSAMMVWARLAE